MDSITVKNVFTEEIKKIDLKLGITWFIIIDKPNENFLQIIEILNSQDQRSTVYVLFLKDSETLRSWIKSLSIRLNCVIATEIDLKEKFDIEETPWYTSFKDGKILYSAKKLPIDLYASFNESLPELESPINTNFGSPIKPHMLESTFQNSKDWPMHQFKELPSSSFSIQLSTEKQLEKALKKIEKLKLKVKEQEQTIEDFKSEMKQLKFLLGPKKPSTNLKIDEPMNKIHLIDTNKLDSFKKKKIVNNISLRNDENDFWNIDDNGFYESFKFEDIAGKDLWLMKLFNKHDSPKFEKNTKVLPPLQQVETQNKALKRDENKYKMRSQSNNAAKMPKKNLKKLY